MSYAAKAKIVALLTDLEQTFAKQRKVHATVHRLSSELQKVMDKDFDVEQIRVHVHALAYTHSVFNVFNMEYCYKTINACATNIAAVLDEYTDTTSTVCNPMCDIGPNDVDVTCICV